LKVARCVKAADIAGAEDSLSITVDIKGGDELSALLDRLISKAGDIRPAFKDIGELLRLSHRRRWDSQVSPEGRAWKPLSEEYLKSKRKRTSRGRNKILVLDEYLRESLRYQVSPSQMEFGTDIPYAPYAHDNRPFLGVSDEDREKIVRILSEWVAE